MNKRPLIFVIALTLALFLLNQYFGSQDSKRKAAYFEEKRKKETEELQSAVGEEQKKKIAPLYTLPLVKLYEDEACTKIATLAVAQDEQFLTLSWDATIPKGLFIAQQNKPSLPVTLRIAPEAKGDPILFSANPQAPLIQASPPEASNFDVQIVTFTQDNQDAQSTLGVVKEGFFVGPIEPLATKGIILYKSHTGYLPWAIYNPSTYAFSTLGNLPYFSSIAVGEKTPAQRKADIHDEEKFYVLENDYLQLVFSNLGGSIAEINLPFRSETNQNSVVLPIGFDRTMEEGYKANDYYPLLPYYMPNSGNTLQDGKLGGYYPLMRRAIMSANRQTGPVAPNFYALNIIDSEDPEFAKIVYSVKRFENNLIEFEGISKGRKITKRFVLPKDPDFAPYALELFVTIEGNQDNLQLTSGVPEVELVSDNFTPSLKYRAITPKKAVVESLDLPKNIFSSDNIHPDWISNSNGFFGIILDPLGADAPGITAEYVPGNLVPSRITMIDALHGLYPTDKYPGYALQLPLSSKKSTSHYLVFAGPYEKSIFEKVDLAYYNESQATGPDFEAAQSIQGWFSFISEPFAKFLFYLMRFFHYITHSWGLSIILLTIALRIMLYPLNAWSIRSTLRMQEIAPHVQALQARYKKDPKRAQMEIMHLYREKGVNPLSGCFPLLIQLPFLIGMFDLLKSTFALRGAGFIPGWIDDLAAPDVLFSWNYPVFFIGHQFHLLPFLLGAVMYVQQRFSASATLVKDQPLTDQQRQQKFMGNIMVVVFTIMFYNFPSGLNIYWLSSMLLGILQQWWMTKQNKKPVVEIIK